jgi:hypothetical protein
MMIAISNDDETEKGNTIPWDFVRVIFVEHARHEPDGGLNAVRPKSAKPRA